MRYQISGKQIDVGEALQTHVKAEMGEVVEKYAQRPTECVVVFSRVAHEFVCEATIHLSTGLTAQAKGHATEIYAAFESCREKMDKQLRRYKRRLRSHHRDRTAPVEFDGGSSYILASSEDPEDAEPDTLQPIVIAEMETKILLSFAVDRPSDERASRDGANRPREACRIASYELTRRHRLFQQLFIVRQHLP